VSFKIVNYWPGGYQGEGTVKAGTSAISGWTVSWTNPSGQTVTQAWNSTLATNTSTQTVVKNASWNASIPANGSTTFGFLANNSGTAVAPTATCTSP